MVRPSPARAEPHDETTWLPLPEPEDLPTVEALLAPDPTVEAPGPRELPVGNPSPARAEPHDETSWLVLPEPESLPSMESLLAPGRPGDVPPPRDLPVGNPSPARAEPHDETTWLPLPDLEPHEAPVTLEAPSRGARLRHSLSRVRVSARSALAVTVLIALAGGALYARANVFDAGSEVDLRIGGQPIAAVTGKATVGELLAEQGITLGAFDRVVPGARTPIEDGMAVRVIRSFEVGVNIDGVARTVFTTHTTPKELMLDAAAQLGLTSRVIMTSDPERITKTTVVVLRTLHSGTLSVDGQSVAFKDAPYATVDELLKAYAITLVGEDFARPALGTVLVDGTTVEVVRVSKGDLVEVKPYNAPDQRLPDPELEVGRTRVQEAVAGEEQFTYRVVTNNGVEQNRTLLSRIPTKQAQPRITYYGTKANPLWDKMAQCETGGNWAAPGPTYQGGLGIYYRNWDHYGGRAFAPTAGQATREEQIIVAERIRDEHGWHAWGCAKTIGL